MKILKTIKVDSESSGQRLDIFLSQKLKISRSQAQKMIMAGEIELNGNLPKKAGDTLRAGDKISIKPPAKQETKTIAQKKEDLKNLKIEIIADTPDYVVVNKPSGLLVHPTQAHETNTLAAWLIKKYPKIKTVGDDPIRPGIVHRLDKEASGIMVVAKTQPMFEHLKEQFKNRTIKKEYFALVHDKIAKDWDEISFPIARGETNERMVARPLAQPKYISTLAPKADTPLADEKLAPGEKNAHTEFFVEKRFVNFTLLRVIIHTGRMHQIRVHLLAYNHPLVGDPLYFQKKRKRTWDEKLGRLFLHSTQLSFTNLSGKIQTFHSPLPQELADFLTTLK